MTSVSERLAGLIDEYGNPLSDEGEKAIQAAYESAEAVRKSALEDEDDDLAAAEPDAAPTDLPVASAPTLTATVAPDVAEAVAASVDTTPVVPVADGDGDGENAAKNDENGA